MDIPQKIQELTALVSQADTNLAQMEKQVAQLTQGISQLQLQRSYWLGGIEAFKMMLDNKGPEEGSPIQEENAEVRSE